MDAPTYQLLLENQQLRERIIALAKRLEEFDRNLYN
jgi:hypothetical protein